MDKLPRSFYKRPTLEVAPELLGKILVRNDHNRITSGRIVEVEAYGGADDPASHAYRGLSERNNVMFGEAGYAYVYLIYGVYCCVNAVTETTGTAGACLIRALEPLTGIDAMKNRCRLRRTEYMTNGPGKLCIAMKIDRRFNGADFLGNELYIADDDYRSFQIHQTPRIGISSATRRLWRFFIYDNAYVSKRSS
jgi:DNA-3-methyladenine glycosylase